MLCALKRTSRNIEKVADGGSCNLSKTSVEQNNFKFYCEGPELSAIISRNSDQRCLVFTLVTLELDDRWKFLSHFILPLQQTEQGNNLASGSHVKMDGLESVSSSHVISLPVDRQRGQKCRQRPGRAYTAKSSTGTGTYGANVSGQSQNRGSINKRTKAPKFSSDAWHQNSNASNKPSDSGGSRPSGSAELVEDIGGTEKPVKQSSKKKEKKKGKQHKKPSSSCSIDGALVSDESIQEKSIVETFPSSVPACGDQPVSENNLSVNSTASVVSLQENTMGKVDSKDRDNGVTNLSVTPTTYTSYSDALDELESTASVPQDFAGEDFSCNQFGVVAGSTSLIDSESMIQTSDVTSNFDGELAGAHLKQRNNYHECSSSFCSEEYTAPMLDMFSDEWNSDNSGNGAMTCHSGNNAPHCGVVSDNCSYDCPFHVLTPGKEYLSLETLSCPKNGMTSSSSVSNKYPSRAIDADDNTDREISASQGCSSSDIHSYASSKRVRQGRKPASSSGTHRFSGGVNIHGRTVKENNHSVWQRVQKNAVDECACETRILNSVCSELDTLSKKCSSLCTGCDTIMCQKKDDPDIRTRSSCSGEVSGSTDMLRRVAAGANMDVVSLKPEDGNPRNRISERLKRKPSVGSKEEHSHNFHKGSHASKNASTRPIKIKMQHKEASEMLLSLHNNRSSAAASRSPHLSGFSHLGTDRVDSCPTEPLQNSQFHLDEANPSGDVCTRNPNVKAHAANYQNSTLSGTSGSSDHFLQVKSVSSGKIQTDLPSDLQLPAANEDNGPPKSESEVPQSKYPQVGQSKQDNSTGSVMQKWVPVGRKDSGVMDMNRTDNLSTFHMDKSDGESCNLKDTDEQLSSNAPHLLSLSGHPEACPVPASGSVSCALPADELQGNKLRYEACSINKEQSSTPAVSSCSPTHISADHSISVFETDENRIMEVVNDAYRLQIESEGVQLATGSPLAEFERVLHSASPVLGQTYSGLNCKRCLQDELVGESLCRHQVANISLGSLWQWYERPGSYGLEVKAVDFLNVRRLDGVPLEFRAYFVPYLSAIQLFGKSKISMSTCNTMPNAEVAKASDVNRISETSSCFSDLPIFSILLPSPRREEDTSLSLPDSSSVSGQDQICRQPISEACPGDSELLFEYFESEQPQLRRPLFEKIKELLRGHTASNCQIFGDPSQLDYLQLNDLHLSSWYSVAWYPIYRIPDGNFRAAFLTYHSLGHFIRRSALADSCGPDTCIVSPVVGLQSYNAQGECWFRPRNSVAIQMEGKTHFNTSEILRERMRTLERTAAVMARASVRKRDQKSVNRQPDYEFFLSRRR